MTILRQLKFATIRTSAVTTLSATATFTTFSSAQIGNSLAVGFSYAVTAGTPSLTSIQDNNGTNLTVIQDNSGVPGEAATAKLLNLTNASTSVTVTVGSSASARISIDVMLYEIVGPVVSDASAHVLNTGAITSLSAAYTTAGAGGFAWYAGCMNNDQLYTPTNGWTIDEQANTTGNTDVTFAHLDGTASGSTAFTATIAASASILWNIESMLPSGGATRAPQLPLMGVGMISPLAWAIRRRQIRARERNASLRQWKRDESSGLILPEYKKAG